MPNMDDFMIPIMHSYLPECWSLPATYARAGHVLCLRLLQFSDVRDYWAFTAEIMDFVGRFTSYFFPPFTLFWVFSFHVVLILCTSFYRLMLRQFGRSICDGLGRLQQPVKGVFVWFACSFKMILTVKVSTASLGQVTACNTSQRENWCFIWKDSKGNYEAGHTK